MLILCTDCTWHCLIGAVASVGMIVAWKYSNFYNTVNDKNSVTFTVILYLSLYIGLDCACYDSIPFHDVPCCDDSVEEWLWP